VTPADTARLLATAVVRAPFALFWGPRCVIRRTAESFFWGESPGVGRAPIGRCAPMHLYRIACEPPCYACDRCRCGHD